MKKRLIKWLAKILGTSFEPPFEMVDNLDIFVKDRLNSMLESAKSFDIATGYFQISGWKAFAEPLERLLKEGGKVRLLIGDVSREYLLPQTARFLLHLIKNPQIEAKTIKPRFLHAKVFMAKTDEELRLLFGSSNLTFGGMEANIELNTYEILDINSKKARDFAEWFERLWESAIPIDEELEVEITLATQKEEIMEVAIEDPNKALFLSLLIKDLSRIDLRDIGNFAPLKFQYVDAVAGVNRFFFQPGDRRGLMLAHEVGLGKTIISGMILKHLLHHKYIKNALIISPLSILRQWREDLQSKFSIEPVEITSRRIRDFHIEDYRTYLISYDLLKQHIKTFPEDWDLIIVDESHFIRNSQTIRFKAVKRLKSKFWLLLTATPMHNKIEDIAAQLLLFVPEEIISRATKREISKVDRTKLFRTFIKRRLHKKELSEIIPQRHVFPPELVILSEEERKIYEKLRDFLSFESKYYQIISRSIQHIAPFVKQRYLEEFTSSKDAAIFALTNLKERIGEAIKKGYIEYNFGLLGKEMEGIIVDEIRSFIEDQIEAQSQIEARKDDEGNLIIKVSIDKKMKNELDNDIQFLKDIIKEIEKIDEFSKVKRVIELIKSHKPSKNKKIVVFVGFIKTGEKLVNLLKKDGIKSEFFHGGLEETHREKLIAGLWSKDEDRIDVLVSTDAAYVGLNLQVADTIIHHDLSWNPMVVEQRIGRIHRIGQKREVTSYSFICKDTIDERKHIILTKKLEEISTHLGMSYLVVLSEMAVSSEIEKLMARLELREIDEEKLEEELKKHITDRKEIFEVLEELPSEEIEILHIGFTDKLIEKIEDIIGDFLRFGKRVVDFKVKSIIENQDFMILTYKNNGKELKELATLSDKALLGITAEEVKEWKKKYGFINLNPSYIGPFHPLLEKMVEKVIQQNSENFWNKKIPNSKKMVSLYLIVPLKIRNLTAGIETAMEIFVPVLYEPNKRVFEINAVKAYNLASSVGRVEELNLEDEALKEAKMKLKEKINDFKDRIKADIDNMRIEIEEIALQKQRAEIEKRIEEKMKKIERLNSEITRKRNSGLRYDTELSEARKLKAELEELQRRLEFPTEKGLNLEIEFGEFQLKGGCIYGP